MKNVRTAIIAVLCTVLGLLVGVGIGASSFSKYSEDAKTDARGQQIAAGLEGQLVACPEASSPESGRIYLIEGGEKHWVATPKWLLLHGYNTAVLKPISAKDLAIIPAGTRFE
jgi:hypothetical protein